MYVLTYKKQIQVLQLLIEGSSISSISRLLGVHRDTCSRLMVRFATACQKFHDAEMRDLQLRHLEIDELETYSGKKQMNVTGNEKNLNEVGEFWLHMALDQDTRLLPSFRVGRRDALNTMQFFLDLASRIKMPNPSIANVRTHLLQKRPPYVTISTDGCHTYVPAIDAAFGPFAAYGSINKKKMLEEGKATPQSHAGHPKSDYVSTSLVERNNLTLRTFIRKIFRKTICFSKKVANLNASVTMHVVHYNYCWRHKSLKMTPAMAAGLISHRWAITDLYDHLRQRW